MWKEVVHGLIIICLEWLRKMTVNVSHYHCIILVINQLNAQILVL